MDDTEVGKLVECIYDLALEPGRWSELLSRVAQAFGGHAGTLEHEDVVAGGGAGVVMGLDPIAERLYFEHYASCNVLRQIGDMRHHMQDFQPTSTIDAERWTKRDLARTEFYADFMRPMGIHSILTLGLWGDGNAVASIDIFRPPTAPDYDMDDLRFARRLHPHVVRAFRLGRRVATREALAGGLAAGLDRAPCGVLLLGADGLVRHANAVAERMLAEPGGLAVLGGRLTACDAADTERLRAIIARAAARGEAIGGAVSVRRTGGRAPFTVAAAPFAAGPFAMFHDGPGVIVSVTEPAERREAPEAYLRDVVGLTEAQAKVARAVLAGQSIAQMATALGVTPPTVKSHLRAAFEKAGVQRQTELAAFLSRRDAPPR